MKNPFRLHNEETDSATERLGNLLGELPKQTKKQKQAQGLPKEAAEKEVKENQILEYLSVPAKSTNVQALFCSHEIFNSVRAEVNEEEKNALEKTLESLVYYQTPETHTIKKESSELYRTVFINWRKGVSEIFAQYRAFCSQEQPFAFFVYIDGVVCFFHTAGYNSCRNACCLQKNRFSLLISGAEDTHFLILESDFQKQDGLFCMSGKSVLFILDTIINLQASSVHALPFVLSKHFFFNGIATRPTASIKAEKSLAEKLFNVRIDGWVMSMDLEALCRCTGLIGTILKNTATTKYSLQ
ncbi:hypothetical protein NECID01_0581 [Nematocida sp. AWRm77]|nr:hypothetical protein NECID01_0581 [Nematocida sp. AWRm77]